MSAVDTLQALLETLPAGHPDRRGVWRALEVLRSDWQPSPLIAGIEAALEAERQGYGDLTLVEEADRARAREREAVAARDEALRMLDAERRGQRYRVLRQAQRARRPV